MKRLLSILTLFGLLSFPAFAEDFLAKVTNGALSDTSEGVKLLSLEEQKKVVGGIYTYQKGEDKRLSNYGVTMRYTVYGKLNLTREGLNEADKMAVLKYERDTYNKGDFSGFDKEAKQSNAIGVTWGRVSNIYVESTYNYSKSVSWKNRYTHNIVYTLEGSNKRYQAYTKQARSVANFYEFRAKNALDLRRF
ncbi:hypothetical protein LS70_007965 [Helicobacter sp. MIT 11-5569]|uniref:hypothetical protein n=1 Tax=Helicobacter sp. MIT 11-5569 TaxID=1548151 RepID=UPI00051FAF6D|nr:hypothetical protein [Helicobacter sp. MIT 11-5569]TLD81219.1 hypothetical protein LS70_007965 [Helicobacter sp. MIT 11-5569]